MTKEVELLYDAFHGHGIGKEEELSRSSYIAVADDVELPDGVHLLILNINLHESPNYVEKLTRRNLASSAGGRYGGSGDFRANAADKVEKYKMMLPTISRRSLLTGSMKSRRTVCATQTLAFVSVLCESDYRMPRGTVSTTPLV